MLWANGDVILPSPSFNIVRAKNIKEGLQPCSGGPAAERRSDRPTDRANKTLPSRGRSATTMRGDDV